MEKKSIEVMLAKAVAAEREACAAIAWIHFMDTAKLKRVDPGDSEFFQWCGADAIRTRGEAHLRSHDS